MCVCARAWISGAEEKMLARGLEEGCGLAVHSRFIGFGGFGVFGRGRIFVV